MSTFYNIAAAVKLQHFKGKFYGGVDSREELENYFDEYSNYDSKSKLEIGQDLVLLDTTYVVVDIKLKMLHSCIGENRNNPDAPVEFEIWVTINNKV